MDRITTCILDLDGPLLDGRERHYACYRDILAEFGCAALAIDEYWRMKRERMDRRRQLAATGAAAMYDPFLQAWKDRIELPRYLELDTVQPGAREKLAQWRGEGKTLVLATMRQSEPRLVQQLERLGLTALLDRVVRCEIEPGACKSGAVQNALGGLDSERTIWIGDTEADASAARAIGCRVWALSCGLRTEEYLASLRPDFLSHDLASVDLAAIR